MSTLMNSSSFKTSAFAVALLMLAGCNTVAGAGKDLEEGGEAVTNAAEEVEDDITD